MTTPSMTNDKSGNQVLTLVQDASAAWTYDAAASASEGLFSNVLRAGDMGGNRIARIIPAVTLATIVGYAGQFEGSTKSPSITGWIDASSQRTWESSAFDRAFASTQIDANAVSQPLVVKSVVEPDMNQSIQDQPRFSYQKAMAYAHELGLRTEFPL